MKSLNADAPQELNPKYKKESLDSKLFLLDYEEGWKLSLRLDKHQDATDLWDLPWLSVLLKSSSISKSGLHLIYIYTLFHSYFCTNNLPFLNGMAI